MQLKTEANTYLVMKDEYGSVRNEMIFVCAKSGWGKGLAVEGFIEEYKKAGYIVLILADPKNEIELGYAQFLPKEKYHLDSLRREGKRPEAQNVKLYHPFTFRIPKTEIPDYNFYTFSLKDMGRKEWGMIAETGWDTDTIKLLMNASQSITNEDGLYSFLHYIQDITMGKKDVRKFRPDWKNFGLSISGGTLKSIQDIANYMHPFRVDYFLAEDTCPLKLDFKKILSDQENYHVFVTNFIKDDKLKELVVLTLFNKIIENKDYAKKPLLIVLPEIRYLVPFKPQGYKLFLAQGIKDNLSMMRSMGKGMTALFDTQVFSGVDEEVSNSATITLFGELGGARDIDKVAKSMNYKRDIRSQLAHMEYPNSYLLVGMEDMGAIRCWFPRHRHCEPHYNFAEQFKNEFPERMKSFKDQIDLMKKSITEEENKIRDKIKKQELREKERQEELKRIREATSKDKVEVEKKIEKAKTLIDKSKMEIMRLVYEYKIKNPTVSWRQIGDEFKLHHRSAKKYFEQYEEEKKKQDAKPDEEKILEELNKGKHLDEMSEAEKKETIKEVKKNQAKKKMEEKQKEETDFSDEVFDE